MNYLNNLLSKITSWIIEKASAEMPLMQTDYGVVAMEVPVQRDILYYLDIYFEYIVLAILMLAAIGVVIWYKFRKNTNVKKNNKTGSSQD